MGTNWGLECPPHEAGSGWGERSYQKSHELTGKVDGNEVGEKEGAYVQEIPY